MRSIFFPTTAWKPGPGNKPMYEGSDMPSADLAEEYAGSEPQPLPPDMSKLPSIPGYENVGYHGDSEYNLTLLILISVNFCVELFTARSAKKYALVTKFNLLTTCKYPLRCNLLHMKNRGGAHLKVQGFVN